MIAKMNTQSLLLTLNKDLFNKLKDKAQKLGYQTPQQYIYKLIRRNVNHKKGAGRLVGGKWAKDIAFVTRKRIFAKRGGKLVD